MFFDWKRGVTIACLLGAQVLSSLFGRVDVYVYNVRAGNFVRILLTCEDGKQKELIIDCGSKNGIGAIERVVDSMDKIDGLREDARETKETMLWITHLHKDHYNGLDSTSSIVSQLCNRIGTVIIGGDVEQAKGCAGFGRWIQQKRSVLDLKVWNYSCPELQSILKALRFFQEGCSGNPWFFAIVPDGYYHLSESDNENAQSLVLGMQYNGVRMLFPGDAPGKMFQTLSDYDKDFVRDVNILIAPHHGSFEANNEWWWCCDRNPGNSPLYCVIASCDPEGHKKWNLPKKEFQEKGKGYIPFRKQEQSRTVAYYNKCRSRYCTKNTYQTKFVTCRTEFGYHIVIDEPPSSRDQMLNQALEEKIKIFEIECNGKDLLENEVEIVSTRTEDANNAILVMPSDDEEEIISEKRKFKRRRIRQ
jgi:hypothetical protein